MVSTQADARWLLDAVPMEAARPTVCTGSHGVRADNDRVAMTRAFAPRAAEHYRARALVAVIETKAGFSVYPFSPAVVELVADDLAGLRSTKGGVQFTTERPVPDEVFDRMVAARRAEIAAVLGARQ